MPIDDLTAALKAQAAEYAKISASTKTTTTTTYKISASVGVGGKNIAADVKTVQTLLNKKAGKSLAVDGSCGPKTKAAITDYQKKVVKLAKPDGRIDVNGKTWNTLIKGSSAATTTTTPKKETTNTTKPTTTTPTAKSSLSASVGEGGKNLKDDVVSVQVLLNKKNKSYELPTNGLNSAKLVAAIKHYQKNVVKLSSQDGRVDPNGKTWNSLTGKASTGNTTNNTPIAGSGTTAEPKWLQVARGEIGQKEIVGNKHNPRILAYHATTGGFKNDETPWCASFVNWVMKNSGVTPKNSARALDWLKWGKRLGKKNPAYGSIAVIDWGNGSGHVGFVVGKAGSNIRLLGGNQGKPGEVSISQFSPSTIVDYVVPSNYTVPKAFYNLTQNGVETKAGSYDTTR